MLMTDMDSELLDEVVLCAFRPRRENDPPLEEVDLLLRFFSWPTSTDGVTIS